MYIYHTLYKTTFHVTFPPRMFASHDVIDDALYIIMGLKHAWLKTANYNLPKQLMQ